MKLNLAAAIVALLTTSVVARPSPDPSRVEVLLAVQEDNMPVKPTRTKEVASQQPSVTPAVSVFYFTQQIPRMFPGGNLVLLDSKVYDTCKDNCLSI